MGYSMHKLILLLAFLLSFPAACLAGENDSEDFYKVEMQNLIGKIRTAAHKRNPHFGIIGNGGAHLYNIFAYSENNSEHVKNAVDLVDGVMIESLNFGYDYEDDKKTPVQDREIFIQALNFAKEQGVALFNIDYCKDDRNKSLGMKLSQENGFINLAANRELDRLPSAKLNEKAITSLRDCQNFCALLNPDQFPFKSIYLDKLKNSNFDLLIIDGYFKDEFLQAEDIAMLKQKPNGKPRLVYCYMSVGEAEEYRWYWDESYKDSRPEWIAAENENWGGNYKVKYWLEPWHKIIYGGENSYLSKILNAGFDGVFLDVVDAFEYFEDLRDSSQKE